MTTSRPKRRWYQFTVGGLLILTTIVSLPLGWFTYQRNKALKEQQAADEFHKLIRDTAIAVRSAAIGKPWEDVQAEFAAAGYQPLSYREWGTERRFVAREDAWAASNGTQHQLIVIAQVDKKNSRVTCIEVGLIGTPKLTHQQVVEQQLYPPKSAIGLCLTHPEVVADSKKLPMLKEVQIVYELTKYPGGMGGFGPLHFHPHFRYFATLTFTSVDEHSGKRLCFEIESNLDPVQDRNGRPITQGFTPSSALGTIEYAGGTFWNVDDE